MLAVALAAAPMRQWEVPQPLEAVEVPGRTVAGGVPVAIRAVRSKSDAESLERFFRAEFKKAGLFLGPVQQLTQHRQVTGLDVEALVSHTVFLQENPDRTTTVIFTEAAVAEREKAEAPRFAPVMPGAVGVLAAQTEGAQVLAYRVKAKPDEVRAFYGQTLVKAGWAEKEGHFERGAELLELSVKQKVSETAVTLTLRKR